MRSLVFDTSDKVNVQQLSTGFWNLNFSSIIPCTQVVIANVIIPRSFYNVFNGNDGITINGILYHLGNGNYAINELMTNLTNLIQTSTGFVVTITQNTNTGKITYTSTSAVTLIFTTCYKLFGMTPNQQITVNPIAPITSPNIYDLNSVPAVYLRCNSIHSNFIYNNNTTNILFRCPVDVEFGQLIVYTNQSSDFHIDVHNLMQLDFRLTDCYGTELNLNGIDWKCELILI